MLRAILLSVTLLFLSGFVEPDELVGKWICCSAAKLGDERIELRKWNYPPCPGTTYSYTEMTFDTTKGGHLLLTTGGVNYLLGAASSRNYRWTLIESNGTLTIKDDGFIVQYLVSVKDSTMILTKNTAVIIK